MFALLVAGVSLGFAIQSPVLGWVGLVLTAFGLSGPVQSTRLQAALVVGSSLLAASLRFAFSFPGFRQMGAGEDSTWAGMALCAGVGIVDRLPIALVLLIAPRSRAWAPLWVPAAWLVGERGMAWVTTLRLNDWLLTQAEMPAVLHGVSWVGQTTAAFLALTLGVAMGTALAYRRWRTLGVAGLAAGASWLIPPRKTDLSALRGVVALRLQRHAEAMPRSEGAELVVWPETASPRHLQELQEGTISGLRLPAPMASSASTHVMGLWNRIDGRSQNSAVALTSEGEVFWHRAKMGLAGFGEARRFGIVLGDASPLLPGDLEPVVQLGDRRVGVLICSEVFDPELMRRATPDGVDLVLVLASDNITGSRPEGRQLMLNGAALAAAERGVSIARASYRGVAALIGPDGTVHARVDSGHLAAARLQP